jgi:DNA-binding response OmpR family regulator
MGSDDYLVKPFQVGELLALVEAVLRRTGKSNKLLSAYDVEINTESHIVTKAGNPVELTIKEFDLLVELMRNKNVALYRDRLLCRSTHSR